MDFLRSAEQESARERKSWGSLGIIHHFSISSATFIKLRRMQFTVILFISISLQIDLGLEEQEVGKRDQICLMLILPMIEKEPHRLHL